MKAIVLRETGGPEKLLLEEVGDPQPGPNEVVVQLKAAALNHRDVWIRIGRYAGIKLPIILGSDGSGEVIDVGEGVGRALSGKAVVIYPAMNWGNDARAQGTDFRILGLPDNGTYAEKVRLPVTNVFPKPEALSFEEAAAVPLAALTAYRAVVTRAQVQKKETVVVTGIGGGVATCVLQIAHHLGARVFVTSASDEKLHRAKNLGAVGGVNYTSQDWVSELRTLAGEAGVDVVIDGAGGETFDQSLGLLKPAGRYVLYGQTTGPTKELQVRRIFWKQLNVLGSTMGTRKEFEQVMELYGPGGLRPVIDMVFPLAQASEAHRRMDQAGQFGRIVLKID